MFMAVNSFPLSSKINISQIPIMICTGIIERVLVNALVLRGWQITYIFYVSPAKMAWYTLSIYLHSLGSNYSNTRLRDAII